MAKSAVDHYLEYYAEQSVSAYGDQINEQYDHVIVIPCYDEPENCLGRIFANQQHRNVLAVVVVNVPTDATAAQQQKHRALLDTMAHHCPLDTLVVDRVNQPIPTNKGVGLARKLGSDIALFLWRQGKVHEPWIRQTDADVVLPTTYFDTQLPASGAAVFPHQHVAADPQLQRAVELYDLHMQHYIDGLRHAGSIYAYPTLGSTMAIQTTCYAQVRGYPQRNAAEDFYLLNKIAKLHPITVLPEPVIEIAARLSQRVPFGTGPALLDIVAGLKVDPSGAFYHSYHPASFELLRSALAYLETLATGQEPTPEIEDPRVRALLEKLGLGRFEQALAKQNQPTSQRKIAAQNWFDAGKSLRFIHLARCHYPDQPLLNIPATRS